MISITESQTELPTLAHIQLQVLTVFDANGTIKLFRITSKIEGEVGAVKYVYAP